MRLHRSRSISRGLLVLLALPLLGCGEFTGPQPSVAFDYDFESGPEGWTADFADYPDGWEEKMELTAGVRPLPSPLDTTRTALFISGANHSDDLFMFWKRRVEGLEPNTTYAVRFRVEVATNAASGCAGIGGAPGESVRLKAGATAVEPVPVKANDGYYRMNIDKGGQSDGGEDALVLGHAGNGSDDCSDHTYRLKSLDSAGRDFTATTDETGRLWLLVGTDSGFEGTTSLYYTRVRAEMWER